MKKKHSIHIVPVLLFITTMACSFSAPGPTVIETPVHLQPFMPAFQVITISTGIDPTQVPLYFLDMGGGHYLLYVYETKKLIHDGRELHSGPLAGVYGGWSAALSHNGLHYAYVLPNAEDAVYCEGNFGDIAFRDDDGRQHLLTSSECEESAGFTNS